MMKGGERKAKTKRGAPVGTNYSVNFKKWTPAQVEALQVSLASNPSDAVALVPISVGEVAHENGKLAATLSHLNCTGYTNVIVLVADTLQRWTQVVRYFDPLLDDSGITRELEKETRRARDLGTRWIVSNTETLNIVFGSDNYTMIRWEDGFLRILQAEPLDPEARISFEEDRARYTSLYEADTDFKSAVDSSVAAFLKRLQRDSSGSGYSGDSADASSEQSESEAQKKQFLCRSYVIEETAAMHALYKHFKKPIPMAYPGGANPALVYAVKHCFGITEGEYPFLCSRVGDESALGVGLDIRIRSSKVPVTPVAKVAVVELIHETGDSSHESMLRSLPAPVNPGVAHAGLYGVPPRQGVDSDVLVADPSSAHQDRSDKIADFMLKLGELYVRAVSMPVTIPSIPDPNRETLTGISPPKQ